MTTTEEAGRKRWKGVLKKEHRAIAAKGGKSAWAWDDGRGTLSRDEAARRQAQEKEVMRNQGTNGK